MNAKNGVGDELVKAGLGVVSRYVNSSLVCSGGCHHFVIRSMYYF